MKKFLVLGAACACISVLIAPASSFAQHEDVRPEITEAEYLRGLRWYEEDVRSSEEDAEEARAALNETLESIAEAEEAFDNAVAVFAEAEKNLDDPDQLSEAWGAVASANSKLSALLETGVEQVIELVRAERWESFDRIWLEKYKNDYEAQSDPFAVRDAIAGCAAESCSASDFLTDDRMAVFQPNVLEMIGAHHAYARGLTGQGVRIGIDDDIVSYRLPEFEGRISFEGANLLYPLYSSDDRIVDANTCDEATADERAELKCRVWSYDNDGGDALFETLAVRYIVARAGWPGDGETWYLRNNAYEEDEEGRWAILPHGGRGKNAEGVALTHGTAVASVAAGRDFGVAPGATIVPIAKDFSPEGQHAETNTGRSLLRQFRALPKADQEALDALLALGATADNRNFDIINRSYGIGVFDPAVIAEFLDDETRWWGEGFRQLLPETWRALMQTGVHPDERTIVVYSAGNQREEFSGLGADIPRYEAHVRGTQLAVMAVDHDGFHASYTNFCGPLPDDWDAERWGRHFCLAAPGTVNAASTYGWNWFSLGRQGTSFAAPIVSGSLALLMEHFRGQLGNVEIVKRLVNTADNTGHYAQLEIYGAGLVDLAAALRPVGTVATGTPSWHGDAAMTMLVLPPAIGGLGQRFHAGGVEVASLDSWGAPFWSSPTRFMGAQPWTGTPLVPTFAESTEHSAQLHLGFTPGTSALPMRGVWDGVDAAWTSGMRLLTGDGRLGIEQAPSDGYRWGVLRDGSSWLGGFPSGAFGNNVDTSTAWFGRSARLDFGRSWVLHLSGTLALAQVDLPSGAMLDVEPHLMSTWNIALERGARGVGQWSRLSLTQPLRAETGKGTLTYLAGLENGAPAYDRATAPLAPQGREVELAFTHETPFGAGRAVFRIAHSFNFLHQHRRSDSSIGFAYRVNLP